MKRRFRILGFFVVFLLCSSLAWAGKALGSPSAPITLEVFSDFQCPACKALYEETLRPLMTEYVQTGKVYLIHRDFPLPMHQYSRQAAFYVNAVQRVNPNKYEQVCTALFGQQTSWSADGKIDAVVAAVMTPVEMKKVRALLNDAEIKADIERDIQLGRQVNLTETPTMVITHRMRRYPVAGNVSYSILRRFLDQLLAQK